MNGNFLESKMKLPVKACRLDTYWNQFFEKTKPYGDLKYPTGYQVGGSSIIITAWWYGYRKRVFRIWTHFEQWKGQHVRENYDCPPDGQRNFISCVRKQGIPC